MKTLLRTVSTAFLCTIVVSASAQSPNAKKNAASDELRPSLGDYQARFEALPSDQAKDLLLEYLDANTPSADVRKVRAWGNPSTQSLGKASDFSQVAPIPDLIDQWFYGDHSTVTVPGGAVILAYIDENNQLVVRQSSDNGATWSSKETVRTDVGGPVRIARMASGRIVIAVPGNESVALAYSDDDGASWQRTSTSVSESPFGLDMKATPDGGLLMTYARFDPVTETFRYVSRKSVNGTAWQPEATVVVDNDDFVVFDATIVAVTESDYVFVFVELSFTDFRTHLSQLISSDGGATWSAPARILENPEELRPLPALAQASDGNTWLVYSDQRDIWYMMSSDGGTTWGSPGRWTRYAGLDHFPSVSVDGSTPLVTFTSTRTFPNGRPWIASLVQGADSNPDYLPPWIDFDFSTLSFEFLHSVPQNWVFLADDETGVVDVTVSYGLVGESTNQVAAADDGNSGDGDAGDGVWGATVPGFPLGRDFVVSATTTDTDGHTGSTFEFFGRTTAIQDAGNVVLGMPGGYISRVEWPAGSGDGYLSGGGLWIGAEDKVINEGMWTPDPDVPASDGPGESSQDIVYGLHEPDWLGESDRLGLDVLQTSYQWTGGEGATAGSENGVVLEYAVRNTGSVSSNFAEVFVGLFLDVDILPPYWDDDVVAYDPALGLFYTYDSGEVCQGDPQVDCPPGYFGLAIFDDPASGKTLSTVTPGTVQSWDFSVLRFEILTSGINSAFSAAEPVAPDDYRMVFAAQPFSLAEAESKTVTFGLALGAGLAELEANMQALENAYQAFVVSVDEPVDSTIPTEFALGQNYPNPFNPSTTISFSLPTAENVQLRVFNVLGEHVETLVAGPRTAGKYEVAWDASRLSSGIYFYRLDAGAYSSAKSLVVLK